MKKLSSVVLCLLMIAALLPSVASADGDHYLEINETNFPDENFRNWIIENLPVSGDAVNGYYMSETQANVSEIWCRESMILSLQGIEFFPNLRILVCSDNQLTEIDTSNNHLLWLLECNYNHLTELDVSSNTALTDLFCGGNQLTELDVSSNTALTDLFCGGNQLTELDVSKNTELTELQCNANQLTELNVSDNTELTYLCCDHNQLTALDVSKNSKLVNLICYSNLLTELDVSDNSMLQELQCYSNQLTNLDIGINTALTRLNCCWNQLTELDVSDNSALTYLNCDNNQMTMLNLSGCTALTKLDCRSNQLTELDLSSNTALTELNCYSNLLPVLDVSSNTSLTNLSCESNQLTELDVSKNTALSYLNCCYNQLTELDVSKNTVLSHLNCCYNQLTALDVSGSTVLETLVCSDNQLTELDVSDNTALSYLFCENNRLTWLDLSGNLNLKVDDMDIRDQSVPDQKGMISNAAYHYDMSQIIPIERLSNIVLNSDERLDLETGVVTFAQRPWTFKYNYRTGFGNLMMEVNVDLTAFDYEPADAKSGKCGDDLYWSFDEDTGALTITGSGEMWEDSLLHGWGHLKDAVRTLDIANGMTKIGEWAFCEFTCLSSVTIPESVTMIGSGAFQECTSLTSVTIPDSVTEIGYQAFNLCSSLAEVTLPPNLTLIDAGMFAGTALKEITIPDGVTFIDTFAFCDCTCLESISIPDSVIEIGDEVFENCTALTSVTLGSGLESIGKWSFDGCASLTDVFYHGTEEQRNRIQIAEQGNEYLLNATWHYQEPDPDARYLEINETNFPDENFRNWIIENLPVSGDADSGYYMTEAQVQAVQHIECSGSGISSLQGIAYFTGLQKLFCSNNQLSVLNVSNNTALNMLSCDGNQLTSLDVSGCTALESLECHNNRLTELDVKGNTALSWLTCDRNQLTTLDVSNNTALTVLGCSYNQLTELDVSSNTKLIDLDCEGIQLTELDVSSNILLKYLNCPNNQLTSLDISRNSALYSLNCSNNQLTALDVSSHNALIELYCGENQLSYLDLSQNTAIEYFGGASQQVRNQQGTISDGTYTYDFTQIVPPERLQNVVPGDGYQFDSETGIVTFTEMSESFTYTYRTGYNDETIDVTVYLAFDSEPTNESSGQCGDDLYWSFDEDTGALTITGSGEMWPFESFNDVPWRSFESMTQVEFPDGLLNISDYSFDYMFCLQSVEIPDTVTRIGDYAFPECIALQSLTLGKNVESIGKFAFDGCESLTEVVFPDMLKSIGWGAFEVCKKLQSITIPNGVTEIKPWTFNYCIEMKTVTIPNSVTSIGEHAFCCDDSITDVYFNGTEAQKEQIVIGEDNDPLLNATWHYLYANVMSKSLTLEGKIRVNFYVVVSDDALADEDSYALVTLNGVTTKHMVKDAPVSEKNGVVRRQFTQDIFAKQMHDDVTIELFDGSGRRLALFDSDGTETEGGLHYSASDYVEAAIQSSLGESLKELVKACANYGIAAQIQFGYEADGLTLPTEVTSVAVGSLSPYEAAYDGTLPAGVTKITSSLLIQADNTIRLYYYLEDGRLIDDYTFTIDTETVTPQSAGNGKYYLEIANIPAQALDRMHTFTVSDGTNTHTVEYCALSYAYKALTYDDTLAPTNLKNMAKALYLYNQKADAYFENN